MSNAVFPELPGLTWNAKRSPEFSTTIVTGADGGETRIGNWIYPRWHWTLSYEFLRDWPTTRRENELRALLGFFLSRQGKLDDFLFRCPDDCAVSGQLLGLGTGAQSEFQCLRSFGGFNEPVRDLIAPPTLYLDGRPCADVAVSSSGLIRFAHPPAAGAVVTADLSYYWRVRFDLDQAEVSKFATRLWEMQECSLVSAR